MGDEQPTDEDLVALTALRADFPGRAFSLQHVPPEIFWDAQPQRDGRYVRVETEDPGYLREIVEAIDEFDARRAKVEG